MGIGASGDVAGGRSGFKFAAAAHAIRPCILSSRFYFQTSECNSVWLFSTSRRSAGRTCSLSATSQMGSPLCARGLLQIHSTLSAPVQILFGINAHECLSNSVTHSILHLSLFLMQIPQRALQPYAKPIHSHISLRRRVKRERARWVCGFVGDERAVWKMPRSWWAFSWFAK